MLNIHIKTYQEYPGNQSPTLELEIEDVTTSKALHFSVEGARRLALELIHAAFCLEQGGEYDKHVGWTG